MNSTRNSQELENTENKSSKKNKYAPKSRSTSHLESSKREREQVQAEPAAKEYVAKKCDNPELEAYKSTVCQFIAGPEYIPSLNAYLNENGYKIVASKKMPNFLTNADKPLQLRDAEIECMKELIMRRKIIYAAQLALSEINAEEREYNQNANLSVKLFDFFGLGSQHFAARRTELEDIIDDLSNADNNIYTLLDVHAGIISNRLANQLNIAPKHAQHLQRILNHIQNYQNQPEMNPKENITIEALENASVAANQSGINLDKFADGEYINLNGTSILASDLRHYEYMKGLGISLTTRYLQNEGDLNDTNFSKDGRNIDFGMTKLNIHFKFGTLKAIDKLTRLNHKLSLGYTARDICNFPYLKDSKPFYWPTRKTSVTSILIDAFSHFLKNREQMQDMPQNLLHDQFLRMIKQSLSLIHEYHQQSSSIIKRLADAATQMVLTVRSIIQGRDAKDIEAEDAEQDLYGMASILFNRYVVEHKAEIMAMEDILRKKFEMDKKLFSEEEIEVYRSLAPHPVFEFFKFKTIMKYLSTSPDFYQKLGEMYLNNESVLLQPLVDDERRNLDSLQKIVDDMPEYQEFLSQHGDFAASLIDNDFKAYADRLQRKIDKHPNDEKYQTYYKNLLATLEVNDNQPRPANRC